MNSFSSVQRLHLPLIGEKGLALLMTFHFKSKPMFSLFKSHICMLSAVSVEYSSFLNEFVCPSHLLLNVWAVSPT